MSVTRYRSIEDMPRPWRDPGDPSNLRRVARMLALYRSLIGGVRGASGVRRFRSAEEANADRDDPYRS